MILMTVIELVVLCGNSKVIVDTDFIDLLPKGDEKGESLVKHIGKMMEGISSEYCGNIVL